jgi:putative heme-binding domain-containing protein
MPVVDLAAVLLAAALLAPQHGNSAEDIENGARLYRANCASCHGPDGDAIPGVDLRRGKFKRAVTDDDLYRIISEGIPGTPMTATSMFPSQVLATIAYLRSLAKAPATRAAGDPTRGRALFAGKGGCVSCHRVSGSGGRLGPDLTDVGAVRTAAYLEASVLRPGESVLPPQRFVRAVTREGATITGRRLNEDTHTVQLIDTKERLLSLLKSELKEYEVLKTSAMPSFEGKFSRQELDDLVAYLASLKGLDLP